MTEIKHFSTNRRTNFNEVESYQILDTVGLGQILIPGLFAIKRFQYSPSRLAWGGLLYVQQPTI